VEKINKQIVGPFRKELINDNGGKLIDCMKKLIKNI
jgi:hypothetical protein